MEKKSKILLGTTIGLGAISVIFISLFAWKASVGETYHTVTFNSMGGSDVTTQKVATNKTAVEPKNPTKEKNDFGGWFISEACAGTAFDFATPITQDITLYADWTAQQEPLDKFFVQYFDENGLLIDTDNVIEGQKIVKPEDPEIAADAFFANWYTDPEYTNIFDFDTLVTGDVQLYAKYSRHLLKMDYNFQKATQAGLSSPEIEIEINAPENEEIFISWGDTEEYLLVTNFNDHLTHTYIEAPEEGNTYTIEIYGQADSISLANVDETDKWKTTLFKDDNEFISLIELYQDMGDPTQSSALKGYNSSNEKSLQPEFKIHEGVTYIPNHFIASSKFSSNLVLFEKILMPNSITTIGDYAFANTDLSEALIRDSITFVNEGAFQNCTSLVYIRTGRYLNTIGRNAFSSIGENPAMYIDNLSFECGRSGVYPTFESQENLTISKLYYIPRSTGSRDDEFLHDLLTSCDWLPTNPATQIHTLEIEARLNLKNKHIYKICNSAYPLIEENQGRWFLTSPCSTTNNFAFYAEVECIDDPDINVSGNNLAIRLISSYDYTEQVTWNGFIEEANHVVLLKYQLDNPYQEQMFFFTIDLCEPDENHN